MPRCRACRTWPCHCVLSELRRTLYLPSSAFRASWYRRPVSVAMTVSWSRLTLLPFVLVGSSERAVEAPFSAGLSPLRSAPLSEDSKSTRPARKPGVWMLAMLSAVTRWRCASPERAACRVVEVVSPIRKLMERVADGSSRTRSTSGYAEDTRERVRGPPIRGDVVLSVLSPHRHPGVRG